MNYRTTYRKIERWVAIAVLGIFVFYSLIESKHAYSPAHNLFPDGSLVTFNYYRHKFLPCLFQAIICFSGFIFLTQYVERKEKRVYRLVLMAVTYVIMAILISMTYSYTDAWRLGLQNRDQAFKDFYVDGFTNIGILFIVYILYYVIKEILFAYVFNTSIAKPKRNMLAVILAVLAGWLLIFALLLSTSKAPGLIALWLVGIPYLLILIAAHIYYLIPLAGNRKFKNSSYLWQAISITAILSFVAAAIAGGIVGGAEVDAFFVFIFLFSLIVVIPAIWIIYWSRKEKVLLQTALGSSQAHLNFLRSQINPHFLFNALNTIYGTALQENAQRTGEGVQKLGDMMRFMLHENMQDKISLARETDYLKNYIDLQRLRTATSPLIGIETNIQEQLNPLQVSPMLLIPFIENAFKHGISLQEPSFIKVSLQTRGSTLYFDVHNSLHTRADNDPEKMQSGIGLQNVKQRLQLLYPGRHELIIRESAKEYFVHLTIQL